MSEDKSNPINPSKKDLRLKRHQPVYRTRREFLGISARVAGLVGAEMTGVGAAALALAGDVAQAVALKSRLDEYQVKERNTDELISRFEKGFDEFAKDLESRAQKAKLPPDSGISEAIQLFRINRNNTAKNINRLAREDLAQSRDLYGVHQWKLENPNFFYIDVADQKLTLAAAYAPISRTMLIKADYDSINMIDNLIVLHELAHVGQDNVDRQEIPIATYQSFLGNRSSGSRNRVIVPYEASAFLFEIYALDLMTDGAFKGDVLKGSVDVIKYRALLRSRPDQDRIINLLATLAKSLFQGRSSIVGYDAGFLHTVRQQYPSQEYEHYDRTPTGFAPMR